MKERIKKLIDNFKLDYKESKKISEIISKQYKRYSARFNNKIPGTFTNNISALKKNMRFNKIAKTYLPTKKDLYSRLGKSGYEHIKQLIMNSENTKDGLFKTGMFFINAGLPDDAVFCLEHCLKLGPEDYILHIYLQFLIYTSPEIFSLQDIYNLHVKWGKTLVLHPKYEIYPNPLMVNRRLKIGFTCHFASNSISRTQLLPILKAHHRDKVEVFMYSDEKPDQTCEDAKIAVDHWRDTHDLNNDEFCEQIRRDQIDILFELNGHCVINRYRALTRKPAPIQINYFNYSCTTGVPGIDYTIASKGNDDFSDLQPYYSEEIFVLKSVAAATAFPSSFPPVSPPPVLQNGFVTFGSFGQAHKVSRDMIKLWCEILKKVPGSRFYMKADILNFSEHSEIYRKHFIDNGIDTSRVILEGNSEYHTLLKLYSKVDIALDTFPYAAGTTTIEALLQGVPVISLVGQRFCSRHGFSNLHVTGHDELLAYTKDEYIKKAVSLAGDLKRLIHYRETLRNDYKNSSRADMEGFINEMENAYIQMWSTYIEQQNSSKRN